MNRIEAKELLPLIQAYAEGKTIQQRRQVGYEDEWFDVEYPSWEGFPSDYRVKSESTYHPFKNQEECWNEMLKHQPFGWVSLKNKNVMTFICYIYNDFVQIHDGCTFHGWNFNYEEMFDKYIFADGMPFGIKEE